MRKKLFKILCYYFNKEFLYKSVELLSKRKHILTIILIRIVKIFPHIGINRGKSNNDLRKKFRMENEKLIKNIRRRIAKKCNNKMK